MTEAAEWLEPCQTWQQELRFLCDKRVFRVSLCWLDARQALPTDPWHGSTASADWGPVQGGVWGGVWGAGSGTGGQAWQAPLPAAELAACPPHAAPERRQAFLLGRLAARCALQGLIGDDVREVQILRGVFGQPVLTGGQGLSTRLSVSLSHRHRVAVAAAFEREHPIGLDLEAVDPDQAEVLISQELPDEVSAIAATARQAAWTPLHRSTLLWSCKEALGKAMHCGLTVPAEFLAVASASLFTNPSTGPEVCLPGSQGRPNAWRGTYRHCPQFAWLAWPIDHYWLTLAHPAHSRLISIA